MKYVEYPIFTFARQYGNVMLSKCLVVQRYGGRWDDPNFCKLFEREEEATMGRALGKRLLIAAAITVFIMVITPWITEMGTYLLEFAIVFSLVQVSQGKKLKQFSNEELLKWLAPLAIVWISSVTLGVFWWRDWGKEEVFWAIFGVCFTVFSILEMVRQNRKQQKR